MHRSQCRVGAFAGVRRHHRQYCAPPRRLASVPVAAPLRLRNSGRRHCRQWPSMVRPASRTHCPPHCSRTCSHCVRRTVRQRYSRQSASRDESDPRAAAHRRGRFCPLFFVLFFCFSFPARTPSVTFFAPSPRTSARGGMSDRWMRCVRRCDEEKTATMWLLLRSGRQRPTATATATPPLLLCSASRPSLHSSAALSRRVAIAHRNSR